MYRVRYKIKAAKMLRRLSNPARRRIQLIVLSLENNPYPSGVKKMKGFSETYRIRVGDYRIIYEIADAIKIITIIKIGPRGDIYKN
jgi:mRNA interferase RelE/StbE